MTRYRPQNQLLRFNYGTKGEKKEEGRSGFRDDGLRRGGRKRSLSRGRNTSLVIFPPLNCGTDNTNEVLNGAEPAFSGWIRLFKGPRKICEDRVLNYTKPLPHTQDELPFVIVAKEAVSREEERWKNCLVAYVMGKKPHYHVLKERLEAQWKVNPFQMHSLEGGFFLFKFLEEADRSKVLLEGPWHFFGRPIILKEWSIGIELKTDQFNALPVWVRLPKLDLRLWDTDSIGRIVSVVGHPRFIDEATASRDRLAFARACVEITPECEFPSHVNILVGTKWLVQEILYEWRPSCCQTCNTFDQDGSKCPEKLEKKEDLESKIQNFEEDVSGWQKVSHGKKAELQKIGPDSVLVSNSKQPKYQEKGKGQLANNSRGSPNVFSLLQTAETENLEPQDLLLNERETTQGIVSSSTENLDMQRDDLLVGQTERTAHAPANSKSKKTSWEEDFSDSFESHSEADDDVSDPEDNEEEVLVEGGKIEGSRVKNDGILGSELDSEIGETDNASFVCETPLAVRTSASFVQDGKSSSYQAKEALGSQVGAQMGSEPLNVDGPVSNEGNQPGLELVIQLRPESDGVEEAPTVEGTSKSTSNFITHRGVRRSPKIRKVNPRIAESLEPISTSKGRKKDDTR